jgi:uncharacterized membrane protein YhaH (DUF805 family)
MSDDSPQPGGVALRDPFYGAPFGEAVRRFFRKYTVFTGRSSRSEFWWWWLTSFAVSLVLQLVPIVFTQEPFLESQAGSYLMLLWVVLTLVGSLAVGARRLHDANLSGFWQFLHVLVGIGSLVLFVMFLLPSNPKGARFDL